jgi:RNA 2',3'-cyclic 3'-phosphodiesterase
MRRPHRAMVGVVDPPGALRSANRLFVAAELPGAARAALARRGSELAAVMGGRPVAAGRLHVTLDFIGRAPPEMGAEIVEAVRAALAGPPIRTSLGGLRARPRAARARLVAVELGDPEGRLAVRAERVRAAVDAVLGRESRDGPLWPHVTVLRLARPARMEPAGAPEIGEQVFAISRGALYDSQQSPGGPPRYRELAAVEFAPVP